MTTNKTADYPLLVCFDRDGTLIPHRDYVDRGVPAKPNDLELRDGTVQGLRLLADEGARIAVCTNQRFVNEGRIASDELERLHEMLAERIVADGGPWIEQWLYCPHGRDEGCWCRKPRPGMLIAALRGVSGSVRRVELLECRP